MSVDNRLTTDQLAALAPGDVVTVESGAEFGRRRYTTGTVVRIAGPHLFVSVRRAYGVSYQEQFRRRDGVRVGGLTRAELINLESPGSGPREARRHLHRIDALYREWARNRADVDRLRRLHDAIGECL